MNPLDNNSRNEGTVSPTPKRPRLEAVPTGVTAGRDVTAYNQNQSSFLCLPDEPKSVIIRYLGLREIARLARVCKYLGDFVENSKALERAWYRRFPSQHRHQLKTIFKAKTNQELRDWLRPFANNDTVESLVERRDNAYFPALFLFTNSKLMSLCEKFNLETKTEIIHSNWIHKATLSDDSRHLVTAGLDNMLKISSRENDGSWKVKANIIAHHVTSATFSPNGCRLLVVCNGNAIIYGMEDDGSWKVKITISHENAVCSATFSADGRHVVTSGLDSKLKIYGLENDGSWQAKATIDHNSPGMASFSIDGRHLMAYSTYSVTIYGKQANDSWNAKGTINHSGWVMSAQFSADGSYVVTASRDGKAKIYGQQDDGSWEKIDEILHDGRVYSAKFSTDGTQLVTASEDKTTKIYGLQAGTWVNTAIIPHESPVHSAIFSADSRHLLTSIDNNTAKIYRQEADGSWVEKATISHTDRIYTTTFSADGCLVVTASKDETAKIYGLGADGSWLQKAIISHRGNLGLGTAAFGVDGRHVVTFSDNTARITELQKDV
ncbi:F-box/WD40 repeat-containing protein [Endozoicomonas sp. 8E]|uniref:F-box/WD repeat-containing protein n=1 Tax=Endozoicomonas sp. 8E TaxID=3035692 RepID=UPI002938D000|nr:F-box/WD40 repeat-containing protein [Endozoicomonas sp. 8E]WOG28266.1 F-box/WD40 repeat-containing protein [Endozoicomonas sp. 8E]